jgi:hypothetical protein
MLRPVLSRTPDKVMLVFTLPSLTVTDCVLELPVLKVTEQLYHDMVDHGWADLDHSALYFELARRNGIERANRA